MLYQYFIDRMTKLMPLRGIRSTQVVSLVDEQLDVLGVQLMRTQASVQLDGQERVVHFFMPDYLFVGLSSELPEDPADAPYHCLCIDDAPLPERYTADNLCGNLIVLQMVRSAHEENMMLALNHAMFILSDEMRFYRGLERIHLTSEKQPDMPEALTLACDLIVNSAAVVDTRGHVLAANSLYPFGEPWLNEQLAAGQLSPELMAELQQDGLYEALRTDYYKHTSLVWTFTKYILMVPIRVRGLQAAWLIVQSTRTALHHSTIRLLEHIARLFSEIIGRQMESHNDRSLLHSLLFQELLRAAPEQEAALRARIEELRWQQTPGMLLLSCQGTDAAFEALLPVYPGARWTVFGASKLLLLYPADGGPDLAATLEKLGLRGGLSWPFDDLMRLRYAYQQAEAALARCAGALTSYKNVFAAHVPTIPAEELSHFVHPAIWRLADYDRSHEGSLLGTLEAVLAGSEQLSEVAEQLFVHRSTLFYRINRIRELGQVDLSNGEERMNLLLSLRLLQGHGLLET